MKLYFTPLACSLATRIAAHEAGIALDFVEIDPPTKRTVDGGDDYLAVNPLGLVPMLRLDSGELLSENAAILAYLADAFPAAGLAPPPAAGLARARLHEWLSFVGTELHKAVYVPLLDKQASEPVKQYALDRAARRLDHAAARLTGRAYLLDTFTVADAYLFTILHWSQVTPIDLARWPALATYVGRMKARPAVQRALAEEIPLYQRELARHRKAS